MAEKEYFINVIELKEGICILCREPCLDKAVMHYEYACLYDNLKKKKRQNDLQSKKM